MYHSCSGYFQTVLREIPFCLDNSLLGIEFTCVILRLLARRYSGGTGESISFLLNYPIIFCLRGG